MGFSAQFEASAALLQPQNNSTLYIIEKNEFGEISTRPNSDSNSDAHDESHIYCKN